MPPRKNITDTPPAAPVTTATEARPLTAAEKATLASLQERAAISASESPGHRFGDPYIALINLSVPRRGDVEHRTDLVMPGETVYLTPEEATQFNRKGRLDGKRIDVVVPAGSEAAEQFAHAGHRVAPRAVSGAVRTPPPPQPGQDPTAPRPDPAGSSHLRVYENVLPEANEPQPDGDSDGSAPSGEAVDVRINPEMVGLR